jgi:hypothetical protein
MTIIESWMIIFIILATIMIIILILKKENKKKLPKNEYEKDFKKFEYRIVEFEVLVDEMVILVDSRLNKILEHKDTLEYAGIPIDMFAETIKADRDLIIYLNNIKEDIAGKLRFLGKPVKECLDALVELNNVFRKFLVKNISLNISIDEILERVITIDSQNNTGENIYGA